MKPEHSTYLFDETGLGKEQIEKVEPIWRPDVSAPAQEQRSWYYHR